MPTRSAYGFSCEREPTSLEQAALRWVVRCERGLEPEQEHEIARWLGACPRHRELFEEFGGTWALMERFAGLSGTIPPVVPGDSRNHRRSRGARDASRRAKPQDGRTALAGRLPPVQSGRWSSEGEAMRALPPARPIDRAPGGSSAVSCCGNPVEAGIVAIRIECRARPCRPLSVNSVAGTSPATRLRGASGDRSVAPGGRPRHWDGPDVAQMI